MSRQGCVVLFLIFLETRPQSWTFPNMIFQTQTSTCQLSDQTRRALWIDTWPHLSGRCFGSRKRNIHSAHISNEENCWVVMFSCSQSSTVELVSKELTLRWYNAPDRWSNGHFIFIDKYLIQCQPTGFEFANKPYLWEQCAILHHDKNLSKFSATLWHFQLFFFAKALLLIVD